MMRQIREKHTKRILWAIAIIIIVTFGLGSAISYLAGRQNKTIGKIGKQKILLSDADYYDKMTKCARFLSLLNVKLPAIKSLNTIKNPGGYLVLVWKADKEKIRVSDQEIIAVIKTWFSKNGQFDKVAYNRFLDYGIRIQPRIFEEYIANFIKIDKLYKKHLKLEIDEQQLRQMYIRDTQKYKIAHVFIPYEIFIDQIKIDDNDIENFYAENSPLFKEQPKCKIAYLIIDDENKKDLDQSLAQTKDLKSLAGKLNLTINTSDFLTVSDPIKGIGWKPQVNQLAFSLDKNERSLPFDVDGNTVIIEKLEEKESFIPPLADIKDKVRKVILQNKLREKAEHLGDQLISDLEKGNIVDLEKLSLPQGVEYKETDYFRYNDYIEGMGLDRNLSRIIFELNKNQIYKRPILLLKGAHIVQLRDKTPFNEEEYKEKRQGYYDFLEQQEVYKAETEFLKKLEKESGFELFPQK